ncbi:Transcriptional regulator, TetR family [Candidatus Sulfopaludibacter sp. SbA3]|nr:Transcriptional regulator, TetR family [Candidatus Sulfopaludibacter sp. SbA3]
MVDTKEKILDTAQRLIGDQGYAATSVRHIISEAGVNLASIHYHFGTKEDLLTAVIARKAGPVNEERLARLNRVEAESGKRPPSVKKVLDAWLLPMAEAADRDPTFVRLMGRMMAEGLLPAIIERHFKELVERLAGALRRAIPDLPDEEFRWRMHFMFGAMAHTMCYKNEITGLGGDAGDIRGRIERLITFLTAGFQAPATPAAKNEGNQ